MCANSFKRYKWQPTLSWQAHQLFGLVGCTVSLVLCCLTLISMRFFIPLSGSLWTCGIWEAVHWCSNVVCFQLQGCRNRAPSHSDSASRNAEESPNKDTGQAVGTVWALLSSEQMSPQRGHLPNLLFCNKISPCAVPALWMVSCWQIKSKAYSLRNTEGNHCGWEGR